MYPLYAKMTLSVCIRDFKNYLKEVYKDLFQNALLHILSTREMFLQIY